MEKQKTQNKPSRKRYAPEYKVEALALAEKVGVAGAAKQLNLHESQLYHWRGKARLRQSQGDIEQQLATENARLKRQLSQQAEELAIVKKAAVYFAKSLK
jgi:transposase